jgi:GT2 family glycosyltransferase
VTPTAGPPLSVVVVNTNHHDLLRQCLAALARADLPEGTEIIVVDNASADGSASMVEREFPAVRLLRGTVRRGPAANYNVGFAAARGDYLVVLNEDAEVSPAALGCLYRHLCAHPRVGLAAPRLIYPDGRPQQSCNRFPGFSSAFKRLLLQAAARGPWVDDRYQEEIEGRAFDPDWIMATSLMIRNSALRQVGPYDEQFEIYYEEIDLCRRLWSDGWRVSWVPEAVVQHHHGVSQFKLGSERDITFRLLLYQSRYRYFRKHHGALFTTALRLVESSLFCLFSVKTALESLLPNHRTAGRLKTRLYGALARYAVSGRGCRGVPQN